MDVEGGEYSWRRIGAEARRWGSRNILGGILLFIGLPAAFSWLPLPLMTTAGILAAAVNIHHFFVDGVIWKLRDAATSSALMMNIAELAGPGAVDLSAPRWSRPKMREAASAAVLGVLAGGQRRGNIYIHPEPLSDNTSRSIPCGWDRGDDCVRDDEFLSGRARDRTHPRGPLAMLVVLIGGFCIFTLFGLVGREIPVVGCLVLLGLIGLFKLMSQFEVRRKRSPSDK